MAGYKNVFRRFVKAVALYEKHHPEQLRTFYDLPRADRLDYYHRANARYSYRTEKYAE